MQRRARGSDPQQDADPWLSKESSTHSQHWDLSLPPHHALPPPSTLFWLQFHQHHSPQHCTQPQGCDIPTVQPPFPNLTPTIGLKPTETGEGEGFKLMGTRWAQSYSGALSCSGAQTVGTKRYWSMERSTRGSAPQQDADPRRNKESSDIHWTLMFRGKVISSHRAGKRSSNLGGGEGGIGPGPTGWLRSAGRAVRGLRPGLGSGHAGGVGSKPRRLAQPLGRGSAPREGICPPPPVRTVEGEQRVVEAALHLPGALRGAAHPQPFVQPHSRDDGVSGVRALSPLGQSRGRQSRHPPAQRRQVPRQLPCSAAHRRRAAPGPARLCPGVCPPRPAPSSISSSSGLEGPWGGGRWVVRVRERSGVLGVPRKKRDSGWGFGEVWDMGGGDPQGGREAVGKALGWGR